MSPAVATALVFTGAVLLAFWLGYWAGNCSAAGRWYADTSAKPSQVEIELEALRSAGRIRHVAAAAEQYMDDFIEEREAERRRADKPIIDGEVFKPSGERWD